MDAFKVFKRSRFFENSALSSIWSWGLRLFDHVRSAALASYSGWRRAGYTSWQRVKRDDLLDLNDVLQHPGRKVAVDISTELPEEADVDLLRPLEGFLEATSTGNLLLITGHFTTLAVLECARCSGPIEVEIAFDLEEQFPVEGIPSSLSAQDFAKVAPDEPFELFEENSLIVENLLRQGLLLSLPVQALCEFGWEGDCPQAKERGAERAQAPAGRPEFERLSNLLLPEDKD